MLFSFNAKDEIYSSSHLMFNLVSGDDVRGLKSDYIPLIFCAVSLMSLQDWFKGRVWVLRNFDISVQLATSIRRGDGGPQPLTIQKQYIER